MDTVTTKQHDLHLGNVAVGLPVVQAALSGYSDWPMRVIARRLGAPYTLCEVMLDRFVVEVSRGGKARQYLQVTDEEHPVGGQLMGADPADFAPATERLVEAGFDVIDINFGCPVKKVLGRCRGGFHLGQPEVALEIIARVREAAPPHIPVTVKMRRGIDDDAASRDHFFEILDGAFARGVSGITVHGRTVRQRYNGPSSWAFLAEVKRHAGDHTILGSGDLFSPAACVEMLAQTGVDGVTVARGAIGNPWIFAQAAALLRGEPLPEPPTLHAQRAVIQTHFELATAHYGSKRSSALMRKFGIKYARLHPASLTVRDAFVAARNVDEWKAVLDRYYCDDLPGRHPPALPEAAETPGAEGCGAATDSKAR
jgi:tRNA-dihydrouridine synthase B